jgi:hypothetical protein
VRVREPTADRDGVLRVEYVGSGRVVDDNRVLEVAPDLRQVLWLLALAVSIVNTSTYLHVVTLVVITALAEEPVVDNTVDIQLVE